MRLKVWGGMTILSTEDIRRSGVAAPAGRQVRCLVAATSKHRAAEMVGESLYAFGLYWCETGNAVELSVATEEGVWFGPDRHAPAARDFKRLRR